MATVLTATLSTCGRMITRGRQQLSRFDELEESTWPKKGKRGLIDTGTDNRFVKRNEDGTFKESVDIVRSLAADQRSKS